MIQTTSSSNRFDGIQVESISRRRRTHRKSKIRPKEADNHHLNILKSQMSHTPVSSKMMNSALKNDDNTFSTTLNSFQQSTITKRSEMIISTDDDSNALTNNNNNNKDERLKQSNQSERNNSLWKYILLILYGMLGIILLSILIFPSIYVYLLAPKYSQTGLAESSIQTNHCAGVSPSYLWTTDTATSITMIIDTSECNFWETPLYFTSISGLAEHFCLTGYGGIYVPTKESFQIYAEATCGGWNGTNFLAAAQTNAWNVNWMGFYT